MNQAEQTARLRAMSAEEQREEIKGAAKDKVLTLPVANAVLAEAAQYAVDHAPGTTKWLGDTLKPKLIARLSAAGALPDEAHAGNLKG